MSKRRKMGSFGGMNSMDSGTMGDFNPANLGMGLQNNQNMNAGFQPDLTGGAAQQQQQGF